jgi:hypothetical protein
MTDAVSQFHDIAMQLVNDCIDYAKGGAFNEQTDANIRQVRIITSILLAALQQAQLPKPRPTPDKNGAA